MRQSSSRAACASPSPSPTPQYQPRQYDDSEQYYQRTPPPPQILTHKQALNHDGNFKYLFTSENGLAQGESIAPDGSRNGGYSYVDPTGRKISVKYTAGKEGFRILEADHLPKAPQPIAPLPAAQNQVPQAYRPQPYNLQGADDGDDGQYRPQVYERPQPLTRLPLPPITQARIAYQPSASTNTIEEKEYDDEPGKANSFGHGYIFEFSG
ncbi:hypothetical protein NQ315_008611 [Exocentrus adspersus]|uniref:Uncharacterized protein n=1 Tax=Exocentrus adspersus TaxID=1586481 RepID=A0AAV8W6J0_9CUCU|nr:hypothetical protein NQ315_008611 [Exocentrus adspersus]